MFTLFNCVNADRVLDNVYPVGGEYFMGEGSNFFKSRNITKKRNKTFRKASRVFFCKTMFMTILNLGAGIRSII